MPRKMSSGRRISRSASRISYRAMQQGGRMARASSNGQILEALSTASRGFRRSKRGDRESLGLFTRQPLLEL